MFPRLIILLSTHKLETKTRGAANLRNKFENSVQFILSFSTFQKYKLLKIIEYNSKIFKIVQNIQRTFSVPFKSFEPFWPHEIVSNLFKTFRTILNLVEAFQTFFVSGLEQPISNLWKNRPYFLTILQNIFGLEVDRNRVDVVVESCPL